MKALGEWIGTFIKGIGLLMLSLCMLEYIKLKTNPSPPLRGAGTLPGR